MTAATAATAYATFDDGLIRPRAACTSVRTVRVAVTQRYRGVEGAIGGIQPARVQAMIATLANTAAPDATSRPSRLCHRVAAITRTATTAMIRIQPPTSDRPASALNVSNSMWSA